MVQSFPLSPLIRLTLLMLYLALTVPLPFLAIATHSPIPPSLLTLGIVLGLLFLYGLLCERVRVDDQEIQVTYPRWFRWLWRRGWALPWQEVAALKMRTTGQGGLVYYFVTKKGDGYANADRAYLLPMRVAGFARLVEVVTAQTGIDTTAVKPLAQPWMYLILLIVTGLLLLVDLWVIGVAV